jgi:polysaccharide export outer membrane protein
MPIALLLAAALQAPPGPGSDPPPAALGAATAEVGRDYRIGPEDVLKIAVYRHPDLTQTVVVQADGAFVFPLLGRVPAADLAPPELERRLADLLGRDFIRDPQVSVTVQEYRSQVVFVVGEVARPGLYPLVGTRRLVEILARSGPLTARAGSEVLVVRSRSAEARPVLPSEVDGETAAGSAEVIRVDLRAIEGGDLGRNVPLLPRDTVFVPVAPRVFVSGRVPDPGDYPFPPGTTVRQAIGLAGGSVKSAARIRVLREAGGRAREVQVALDDLVQAGDTIVVR